MGSLLLSAGMGLVLPTARVALMGTGEILVLLVAPVPSSRATGLSRVAVPALSPSSAGFSEMLMALQPDVPLLIPPRLLLHTLCQVLPPCLPLWHPSLVPLPFRTRSPVLELLLHQEYPVPTPLCHGNRLPASRHAVRRNAF